MELDFEAPRSFSEACQWRLLVDDTLRTVNFWKRALERERRDREREFWKLRVTMLERESIYRVLKLGLDSVTQCDSLTG